MAYMVLDTETTGFNHYKDRVTQIAFIVFDDEHKELFRYNEFIKPEGWTIPKTDFFLEHNMSTEKCERLGVPLYDALRAVQDNLKKVNLVVGHNIAYDKRFILEEMRRKNITVELFKFKKTFCTMQNNRVKVGAVNKSGGLKNPSLKECAVHFGVKTDILHDALEDILITSKIYKINKNGTDTK